MYVDDIILDPQSVPYMMSLPIDGKRVLNEHNGRVEFFPWATNQESLKWFYNLSTKVYQRVVGKFSFGGG